MKVWVSKSVRHPISSTDLLHNNPFLAITKLEQEMDRRVEPIMLVGMQWREQITSIPWCSSESQTSIFKSTQGSVLWTAPEIEIRVLISPNRPNLQESRPYRELGAVEQFINSGDRGGLNSTDAIHRELHFPPIYEMMVIFSLINESSDISMGPINFHCFTLVSVNTGHAQIPTRRFRHLLLPPSSWWANLWWLTFSVVFYYTAIFCPLTVVSCTRHLWAVDTC